MKRFISCHLLGLSVLCAFWISQAEAVPSFARQTQMACAACHTVFPELNAFGRSFKLNGYTLAASTKAHSELAGEALQLNDIPPLSAMLQLAAVHASKETDGTDRSPSTTYNLPDELSLFYAGRISENLGAFIQMTMEQGTGFSLDNTDIRYASHSGKVTYGITANNSPTVQDVWNSTPVWGFPFTHGAEVTSPVIADALAQNVVGIGGYADWGNGMYTELTGYGQTNAFDAPSGSAPGQVLVHGTAPYWRVAWHRDFSDGDSLMLGTYGMQTELVQDGDYNGPADKYLDVGLDSQYEHQLANSEDRISVHASYVNEDQTLNLSGGGSPTLKNLRLDATYHWGNRSTASLGYVNSSGNNGAYDDTAITGQVSYLPWQNTKFTAQYVAYSKLHGVSSGASDANTLLLQGWLLW